MCLCIKVLPQAQNKSSFPQSQRKLNAKILRKRGKKLKNKNEQGQIKQADFT